MVESPPLADVYAGGGGRGSKFFPQAGRLEARRARESNRRTGPGSRPRRLARPTSTSRAWWSESRGSRAGGDRGAAQRRSTSRTRARSSAVRPGRAESPRAGGERGPARSGGAAGRAPAGGRPPGERLPEARGRRPRRAPGPASRGKPAGLGRWSRFHAEARAARARCQRRSRTPACPRALSNCPGGVGSASTQPSPGSQASTHACASDSRTTWRPPPTSVCGPTLRPFTNRAGTPCRRSRTTAALAKYSQ